MATAAVFGTRAEITVDQIYEPTKPFGFANATRYRIRLCGMGDVLTFVAICEHGMTRIGGEMSMCDPFSMVMDARNVVAAGKSLDTVVKADWLEEHGFPEAAAKLRTFDDGF